ncbi:energy transducer TonB [Asticcacaulis machinosus]|uniref:Energy transducer TonB n=1 Tax=Asticcacaulis machinosus TaxID=2984211 RepID=A0ABT5HFL8_9CAUL|nr:energy transducer TonB [Asticcacaulis machinosus]MDC7675049.1 energy transducer TonB [Asticcacaulis machinosus]
MSASIRTHVLAVGASVLVNGGFLAMVMFIAPEPHPVVFEEAAMMVTMVGPSSEAQNAPSPPDLPQSDTQPDTQQDNKPSENHELEAVKPLPVKPSPLEPVTRAPSEPLTSQNQSIAQEAPSKLQTSSSAAAQNAAPVSEATARAASPVAQPAAMSNTSRNHTNAYLARVRAYVESHKVYPRGAKRLRQQGVVTISFAIDRSGRLLASRIVKSSGIAAFDQESLAVLERAQPFPKPPKDVVGDRIEITTEIEFSLIR